MGETFIERRLESDQLVNLIRADVDRFEELIEGVQDVGDGKTGNRTFYVPESRIKAFDLFVASVEPQEPAT